MNVLNDQIGGTHYKGFKVQPLVFIVTNNIPFTEGNLIKYTLRYQDKNGLEDINKAIDYIDKRLAFPDYPKQAHSRTWAKLPAKVIEWYENEGQTFEGRLPKQWEVVRLVCLWLETRGREHLHEARAILKKLSRHFVSSES